MRGQARGSPVLVQRAVSEDPRWTRAMGDPLARPQGKRKKSGAPSMRAVKDSLAAPLRAKWGKPEGPRPGNSRVSARRGWAGKKVARSGRSIGALFLGGEGEPPGKDYWTVMGFPHHAG